MKIGVIGAGHIGGNVACQALKAGHEVKLSFSREPAALDRLARELGPRASTGTPSDAVEFGEIVVLSVPWGVIPQALEQAGDLGGKVVVDTTNQFGSRQMSANGQTAAAFNARRTAGARYVKSFNTLTARFQEQAADRDGAERVVQWLCGDDPEAKKLVAGLIDDMGYVPIDLGGTETCHVIESPRRPGAVYGEEYRAPEAMAVVDAVHDGAQIGAAPRYRWAPGRGPCEATSRQLECPYDGRSSIAEPATENVLGDRVPVSLVELMGSRVPAHDSDLHRVKPWAPRCTW